LQLGIGGGALLGGWGLTDWLLNRRRRSQLQSELESAQQDYQKAIKQQFQTRKQASADTPASTNILDDHYTQTKCAGLGGQLGGGVLAALGLLAAGGALGTYQWTKGRSASKQLKAAQRERARMLWEAQPQPIYAVPVPVK
jgi:hypothetical protein